MFERFFKKSSNFGSRSKIQIKGEWKKSVEAGLKKFGSMGNEKIPVNGKTSRNGNPSEF